MPNRNHESGVAKVLADYPDARIHGFMRACNAITEPIAGEKSDILLRPDAFIIDRENELVVAFEVEEAHPVTGGKISRYRWLWWDLNYADWGLWLIIVSGRWRSYVASIDMGDVALMAARRNI